MLPAEANQLQAEAQHLSNRVEMVPITNHQEFADAGTLYTHIAAYIKKVGATFDPIVDTAHTAWTTAKGQRDIFLKPAEEARRILSRRLAAYEAEVEQRRQAALEQERQERLRREREAKEAAESERRRLQALADQRALDEAEAAALAGDEERANRIISTVPVVSAAPPTRETFVPAPPLEQRPVAEGLGFRDNWVAEVDNLLDLVQSVATGAQPLTLVLANTTALNGMARALRQAMKVPGVRAVNKRVTQGRGR